MLFIDYCLFDKIKEDEMGGTNRRMAAMKSSYKILWENVRDMNILKLQHPCFISKLCKQLYVCKSEVHSRTGHEGPERD